MIDTVKLELQVSSAACALGLLMDGIRSDIVEYGLDEGLQFCEAVCQAVYTQDKTKALGQIIDNKDLAQYLKALENTLPEMKKYLEKSEEREKELRLVKAGVPEGKLERMQTLREYFLKLNRGITVYNHMLERVSVRGEH